MKSSPVLRFRRPSWSSAESGLRVALLPSRSLSPIRSSPSLDWPGADWRLPALSSCLLPSYFFSVLSSSAAAEGIELRLHSVLHRLQCLARLRLVEIVGAPSGGQLVPVQRPHRQRWPVIG